VNISQPKPRSDKLDYDDNNNNNMFTASVSACSQGNNFSALHREISYIPYSSCGKYRKERDPLYPDPVLNRIGCCQAEKQEKSKNWKRTLSSSN